MLFSLSAAADAGSNRLFDALPALTQDFLLKLLATLLVFIVGYFVIKYLCRMLDRLFLKTDRLDRSLERLIVSVLRWGLLFLLGIICADRLGIPTASLVTVLGAAGLAFSLALQNSLSNLAGGIFILTTKPFRTGDYIAVAGTEGTVETIGLIHTHLHAIDNRSVYVPNSAIMAGNVTNYTESRRRLDLLIPVPYECSLEQAKRVIARVASADSRVQGEPFVRVWELSSSSVDIKLRVWCAGADYWELRSSMLEAVKIALDEEGISIPYSHLNIHVLDDVRD
jgi:Small-conductance mechanosensitive channel